MKIATFAAVALTMGCLTGWAQDNRITELQFHRVHLRNGNFVDGKVVRQTEKEVTLKLDVGELSLRMDLVETIELVKMKSYNEKPIELKKPVLPPPVDGPRTPAASGRPTPVMASKVKLDPQTEETVQLLLEDYFKSDVEMKQAVLGKLINLGGSVPAYLISILSKFDRDQVPVVLSTLAQTKDAKLIPYLAAALESDDPSLRLNLVMAMGAVGDPSAVSALRTALKDKDASVRAGAVTALSLVNSPDAFEPLLPLMEDPDRETRVRVIAILNEMATKFSQQKALGDAIAAALPRATGDARLELIYAAGHGGNQDLWRALAPSLKDDSAAVREATVSALADLGSKDSATALLAAIQTEDQEKVQLALIRAVQQLALLPAGGALIRWVSSGSADLKSAARRALTALAGQDFGSEPDKWKEWWDKTQQK